jgi:hypothetical protein
MRVYIFWEVHGNVIGTTPHFPSVGDGSMEVSLRVAAVKKCFFSIALPEVNSLGYYLSLQKKDLVRHAASQRLQPVPISARRVNQLHVHG